MRSIIRREKTSIVATLNCRSSMIVGETYAALAERKSCSLSEPMPQCSRAYFSNSEVMSISFSVKKDFANFKPAKSKDRYFFAEFRAFLRMQSSFRRFIAVFPARKEGGNRPVAGYPPPRKHGSGSLFPAAGETGGPVLKAPAPAGEIVGGDGLLRHLDLRLHVLDDLRLVEPSRKIFCPCSLSARIFPA